MGIEGETIKETENAILFDSFEFGKIWIPRSVITDEYEDCVYVKEWFYNKEIA